METSKEIVLSEMNNKQGLFFVNHDLVPVKVYQKALITNALEPMEILRKISRTGGWGEPLYGAVDHSITEGFLCSVTLRNKVVIAARRQLNLKLAQTMAAATFLNFLGFDVNYNFYVHAMPAGAYSKVEVEEHPVVNNAENYQEILQEISEKVNKGAQDTQKPPEIHDFQKKEEKEPENKQVSSDDRPRGLRIRDFAKLPDGVIKQNSIPILKESFELDEGKILKNKPFAFDLRPQSSKHNGRPIDMGSTNDRNKDIQRTDTVSFTIKKTKYQIIRRAIPKRNNATVRRRGSAMKHNSRTLVKETCQRNEQSTSTESLDSTTKMTYSIEKKKTFASHAHDIPQAIRKRDEEFANYYGSEENPNFRTNEREMNRHKRPRSSSNERFDRKSFKPRSPEISLKDILKREAEIDERIAKIDESFGSARNRNSRARHRDKSPRCKRSRSSSSDEAYYKSTRNKWSRSPSSDQVIVEKAYWAGSPPRKSFVSHVNDLIQVEIPERDKEIDTCACSTMNRHLRSSEREMSPGIKRSTQDIGFAPVSGRIKKRKSKRSRDKQLTSYSSSADKKGSQAPECSSRTNKKESIVKEVYGDVFNTRAKIKPAADHLNEYLNRYISTVGGEINKEIKTLAEKRIKMYEDYTTKAYKYLVKVDRKLISKLKSLR